MIVLGRITEPYGVQGWVRIHPFGDDPLAWRRMKQWWLSASDVDPGDAWRPYRLKGCRAQGKGLVAAFEEIVDRAAAEGLAGMFIGAPREDLPATAEDEYYWADLIGLAVVNRAGAPLGTVEGLLETGAHDVLQVRDGEQTRLIPFVSAYVENVDLEAAVIRVEWEPDW